MAPVLMPADALAAITAQYDVIRVLGEGASGTVYLAQERLLQRRVAVKLLQASASIDDAARARFLREARTAARLSHPNIVPLYSFIEAGSSLLYVMGYVEGESLAQLLEREGRLQPAAARRILDEIADALGYAHAQGVVHRDVKPDNILIESGSGRAFLADFGIARDAGGGDTLTHVGTVIGTPHYMSPEQAGSGTVDARSDLYSLGVVGFELLSGRLPFIGSTLREVLAQRIAGEAPSLSALLPDTPDDLSTAVTRALRRDPTERWKDAAALRASLHLDLERAPALPDRLESLPSMGAAMLGFHGGFAMLAGVAWIWDQDPAWIAMALVTPAISFPLVLGNFIYAGKKEGYGWRRILTMFFWSPQRWLSWWPRRLRRPGNVWDRLPESVRRFRVAMLAAAATAFTFPLPFGALMLLLAVSGERERMTAAREFTPWVFGVLGVAAAVSYVGLGWTLVWKRKFGLTSNQSTKLLTEPLVSAFWKRPEIARLLGDEALLQSSPPKSPIAMSNAIEAAVLQLNPALREQLGDVSRLARDASAFALRIQNEMRELAREVDPQERRKLERRLEELGSHTAAGRAQLRELVHAQLRVMDELEQRRAALAQAYERIERGLAHVWRQVSSLRGEGLDADLANADITGRIRALCADLAAHEDAVAEVTHLLDSKLT